MLVPFWMRAPGVGSGMFAGESPWMSSPSPAASIQLGIRRSVDLLARQC
jgi:hypothetical protein